MLWYWYLQSALLKDYLRHPNVRFPSAAWVKQLPVASQDVFFSFLLDSQYTTSLRTASAGTFKSASQAAWFIQPRSASVFGSAHQVWQRALVQGCMNDGHASLQYGLLPWNWRYWCVPPQQQGVIAQCEGGPRQDVSTSARQSHKRWEKHLFVKASRRACKCWTKHVDSLMAKMTANTPYTISPIFY